IGVLIYCRGLVKHLISLFYHKPEVEQNARANTSATALTGECFSHQLAHSSIDWLLDSSRWSQMLRGVCESLARHIEDLSRTDVQLVEEAVVQIVPHTEGLDTHKWASSDLLCCNK